MTLWANENFPKAAVLLLRSLGYNITSIGEDNPSDQAVMQIAEAEYRTILTFGRDYGELIYKHNYKPEPGIIYLRLESYTPEEPPDRVHELLRVLKIEASRRLTVYDGKNETKEVLIFSFLHCSYDLGRTYCGNTTTNTPNLIFLSMYRSSRPATVLIMPHIAAGGTAGF